MSASIADIVNGVVDGSLGDEQVIDWLRSVFENGLDEKSTINLTELMRDSGQVLTWPEEWSHLVVDKHSTGGVGDKVSIALAPALAACGLKVPMISGRGLGHTGGTLDKMESIAGFRVDLSIDELQKQAEKDLKIDDVELGDESLKTANLHQKYLNIFMSVFLKFLYLILKI